MARGGRSKSGEEAKENRKEKSQLRRNSTERKQWKIERVGIRKTERGEARRQKKDQRKEQRASNNNESVPLLLAAHRARKENRGLLAQKKTYLIIFFFLWA